MIEDRCLFIFLSLCIEILTLKEEKQMLKNRVENFIEELDLPKSRFAKKIGISVSALKRWLAGDLELSQATQKRIDRFLTKFNA